MSIHNKVLALPLGDTSTPLATEEAIVGYQIGHKDALHQAASLAHHLDNVLEESIDILLEARLGMMGDESYNKVTQAVKILSDFRRNP